MRKKVLLVRPKPTSFTNMDLRILRKAFDVTFIDFGFFRIDPVKFIRSIFAVVFKAKSVDLIYTWFADFHSLISLVIAKVFGKKFIVVLGGYELARIEEISYGSMLSPIKSRMVRILIDKADLVIAVDESLAKEAAELSSSNGKNIITIPTSYDPDQFFPSDKKADIVLSVAFCENWQRVRLKGLDLFVEAAKFLPNVNFIAIGAKDEAMEKLKGLSPPNVMILPPVPQDELVPYYQQAKVYCQLSMREGLPNALCEAMLCECVPVGTKVGGIPMVIGDTGYIICTADAKRVADAIEKGLNSNNGHAARERIVSRFSISQREQNLIKKLNELLAM